MPSDQGKTGRGPTDWLSNQTKTRIGDQIGDWIDDHLDSMESWTNWLIEADPRLKIVLTILWGGLTWKAGPAGLIGCALILIGVLFLLRYRQAANPKIARTYFTFVLGWMSLKLILDLWAGIELSAAAANTGIFGLRLFVLLLLGLFLAQSTSPRRLGLALSWFLRPIAGRNSWKSALALALMVHFLPLIWQTMDRVKTTILLRAAHASWRQRQLLFLKATLRTLSHKTYQQAMAIAARGLDSPEMWVADFNSPALVYIVGVIIAALGVAWTLV
ncbi:MAG: hypothetical protein HQK55_19650 [Deltaproteobacteria bacterium]|nr:hypothetical protein [Deltaproteobacteria bacterium]